MSKYVDYPGDILIPEIEKGWEKNTMKTFSIFELCFITIPIWVSTIIDISNKQNKSKNNKN